MAYLALYRKYRPSKFSEVTGQEIIVQILKNSIKLNKISHAYLFSGPRGTGKTSVAKIFARSVNCESPIDGEACDKCSLCKKITENDIDIIEIDAASNNGVDEIREIRNNSKLSPSFCKYKVYIIDEVHMLSSGAFNALLKTLEEPPKHVIFILATTEIQKIPLTILSRCQRYDFKKIIQKNIEKKLKQIVKLEKIMIDDNSLELISELSDGGLRDAINLLDQASIYSKNKITEEEILMISGGTSKKDIEHMFDYVIENKIEDGLKLIEQLYENGKNFVVLAEKMLLFIRDINIINTVHNYYNKKYEETLLKYNSITIENCNAISSILIKLIDELKNSTNQKMLFEIYYLTINNLFNSKIISREIIKKTEKKVEEKKSKNNTNIASETNNSELQSDTYIYNALATASKEKLKHFINLFSNFEEYLSSKKFNTVIKILLKGTPVVGAENYLILKYENDSMIEIFYKNSENINNFFEKELKQRIKIVSLSSSEWNKIKEKYIEDKKNGIIYKILPETNKCKDTIASDNRVAEIETSAAKIFGKEKIFVK